VAQDMSARGISNKSLRSLNVPRNSSRQFLVVCLARIMVFMGSAMAGIFGACGVVGTAQCMPRLQWLEYTLEVLGSIFSSSGQVDVSQRIARLRRGIQGNRRAACFEIFGKRPTAGTDNQRNSAMAHTEATPASSPASASHASGPLTHFFTISTPRDASLAALSPPLTCQCECAAAALKSVSRLPALSWPELGDESEVSELPGTPSSFRMLTAEEIADSVAATAACRQMSGGGTTDRASSTADASSPDKFSGESGLGLVLSDTEDDESSTASSAASFSDDMVVTPFAYAISAHSIAESFAPALLSASVSITGRTGKFWNILITKDQDQATITRGAPSVACMLSRRYSEFRILDRQLRPWTPCLPPLPAKSAFFRKNFKPGFMAQRRRGLEAYVETLLSDRATLMDPAVCKFLGLERSSE